MAAFRRALAVFVPALVLGLAGTLSHVAAAPPPSSARVVADLDDPAPTIDVRAVAHRHIKFRTARAPAKAKYIAIFSSLAKDADIFDVRRASREARASRACVVSLTGGIAVLDTASANAADLASGKRYCRNILTASRSTRYKVLVAERRTLNTLTVTFPPSGRRVGTFTRTWDGNTVTRPAALGRGLAPAGKLYYRTESGPWLILPTPTATTDGVVPLPKTLSTILLERLWRSPSTPVSVYATMADGAIRALTFALNTLPKPVPASAPAPAPTQERANGNKGAGQSAPTEFEFDRECRAEIAREAEVTTKGADWFYYVCVDFTDPEGPESLTLPVGHGGVLLDADPDAPHGHVFAGRRIKVRMFYIKGAPRPEINVSGRIARPRTVYIDRRLASKMDVASAPSAGDERKRRKRLPLRIVASRMKEFESSNAPYRTLEVSLGGPSPATKKTYTKLIRVEQEFTGSLSLGVAFSWAPWERNYELRSSATLENPGKVIGIAEGAGQGIPALEVALSYIQFFSPVYEHRGNTVGGWMFGVGVLQASAKGIDLISSIHTGPAISIGRDFSIAATVSLRRTTWLSGDYRAGSALPNSTSKLPTTFGVTPGFGIVINFSPAVWDAIGKVSL